MSFVLRQRHEDGYFQLMARHMSTASCQVKQYGLGDDFEKSMVMLSLG